MKFKYIILIMVGLLMAVSVKGWNSREVNTLAIATALGIDKSEEGVFVTIQVLNPRAIASKNAVNESPVIIFSEKGKNLFEALEKISFKSTRMIYLQHLSTVVFGEEFARSGIRDTLDYILREHEFRTDFEFVVARDTTASAVLSTITSYGGVSGVKISHTLELVEQFSASVLPVRIIELVNHIVEEGKDPVLTGVEQFGKDMSVQSTIDVLKAPEPAINVKLSSLGVFKDDKLVGWLSQEESAGYSYLTNNVKFAKVFVETQNKCQVGFYVTSANAAQKAKIADGEISIDVELKVKADIESVSGNFDITKEENVSELIVLVNQKISEFCNSVVIKAQKEFQSDILGFGGLIHRSYPEIWKNLKNDWNSKFAVLPVTIHVETKIEHTGAISKPVFIKEEE